MLFDIAMRRIVVFKFASVFFVIGFSRSEGFKVSKISTKTSYLPGSGMDHSSISLFGLSNGGDFSLNICSHMKCCSTGMLDTKDDNWELGQVDWFVGRQLGMCSHFNLDTSQTVRVKLKHTGFDAGRIEWIRIHPWHSALEYVCRIGIRLDHSSSHDTECSLVENPDMTNKTLGFTCNGHRAFCWLRFDQFLFPGTHNSGTGQKEGLAKCASKNQDLNIVEQLEFGCTGLETGHGSKPEMGLYQCYGRMKRLLVQMARWLNRHRSEIVVLHFGNIGFPIMTIPRLKKTLKHIFARGSGVKCNRHFKQFGEWPMMGDAVTQDERVFVFIRDEIGKISKDEFEFVKEIKRKPEDILSSNKTSSEVFITSSYKAGHVGSDCSYILQTSIAACNSDEERGTDFLKLSLFSRFGKGGTIGTECLHEMAKKCNQWILEAILNCNFRYFRPNFVLVDYPNYQGLAEWSIVQLAEKVNMARTEMVWGSNHRDRY